MGRARPTVANRPRIAGVRRLFHIFKGILIASLAIYALYSFSQSEFFALKAIDVHGQQHLAPDQVIVESGLNPGTNIFSINIGLAKKQLLADPWIASANIELKPPNRIEIDISERQPSALLMDGVQWLVLDQHGFCIADADALHIPDLPIITGLSPATADPGKQASVDPVLLAVPSGHEPERGKFFF